MAIDGDQFKGELDGQDDIEGAEAFVSELEQEKMYVFSYPSKTVLQKQHVILLRVSEAIV